jgi:CheY-like chemotaxis protein
MLSTPMAVAKKILILEDDSESRLLYEEILNGENFTTVGAQDGRAALESLDSEKELPDIILMDLTFPLMTAEEFVSAVRSNQRYKDIPLLVISGHVDTEERALALKANGFLKKPFDIDQLIDSINKAL